VNASAPESRWVLAKAQLIGAIRAAKEAGEGVGEIFALQSLSRMWVGQYTGVPPHAGELVAAAIGILHRS
jgi:hypothetical protein